MAKKHVFLIDGFNVYHALDDDPNLHKYKWLNYMKLVSLFYPGSHRVLLFTALAPWGHANVRRHQSYLRALESKGVEVLFGIHPVAGRMPGHMNVLLAEVDISYEKLKEMDEINSMFSQTDIALVIGANDVTNPVARNSDDPSNPIAGMPILDVDQSQTVVVIKRSLSPGFAGIPNPLFAADNCLMLFGDAKQMALALTSALKDA